MIDLKIFCLYGYDKAGRPNIHFNCDNFYPDRMTLESMLKFCVALCDFLCVSMPPHVDMFNILFNCKGAGTKNLNLKFSLVL